VQVETILLHASGQTISDVLTVPVIKPDAQGLGSAITYARRYALAAFVGVAPEDDDGEAGVSATVPPDPPAGFQDWFDDLAVAVEAGTDTLRAAWKDSPAPMREFVAKWRTKDWEAMKIAAAKTSAAGKS
jgi:hypothetical protein